jgi:hypothetical protein
MSGGVSGAGGIRRADGLEAGDPAKVDALVSELHAQKGSGASWMSFLDADSSTKKLAEKLLKDGTFDANDAKALVKDAKDYGKITSSEKRIFANLLRDHAAKITPEARDALAKFFDLPVGRPQLVTPAFPGEIAVVPGASTYSLEDDTLVMTGSGRYQSSIGRDIYTAGYLPMKEGTLLQPLGTRPATSSVLSGPDNTLNKDKSSVERFDEAMKRGTGAAGGMAARYAKEGKRDEADSWWGFCDRWAYNALDPEVATRVNEPIYYKGVYFSTAELRGLATFTGRSDESGGLFDKSVTPVDLQKATAMFLKQNGPGFISDVWLDSAHPGNPQVWNQPFHAVDQNVKELTGDELKRALKEQFKLEGAAAQGKKLYYVETTGHYGVEATEDHEGPATHASKTWKSYILAESDGKAIDGKWAKGSDDAPEYIWMPRRTGTHGKEAQFFRDMIKTGVPAAKVTAFESALAAAGGQPLDATRKAAFIAAHKGVAGAFPEADLDAKLRPLGLKASDLR